VAHELTARGLLVPPAITIVGASENSAGASALIRNLRERDDLPFPGPVHLVNRNRDSVLGYPCTRSVADLAEPGLIFMMVPVAQAAAAVRELPADPASSAPTGLVLFAERPVTPDESAALDWLLGWARDRGIALLGPQSAGLASTEGAFVGWTSALPERHVPGPAAILAQSGGVLTALTRALWRRGVGITASLSFGLGSNLGYAALGTELLGHDQVQVLAMYVESLESMQQLRELGALSRQHGKPLVLLSPGRTATAREMVASHVDAISTDDRVLRGAAEQFGFILVTDLEEMTWTVESLVRVGPARRFSPGVALLSSSGGAAVLTAEALGSAGIELLQPATGTQHRVAGLVGANRTLYNPLDVGGGLVGSGSEYCELIDAYASDPGYGIIIETSGSGLGFSADTVASERQSIFTQTVAAAGKLPVLSYPVPVEEGTAGPPGAATEQGMRLSGARRTATMIGALIRWAAITASPVPATDHTAPETSTGTSTSTSTSEGDGEAYPPDAPAQVLSGAAAWQRLSGLTASWPSQQSAATVGEAAKAATEIGFPVVVKTEAGLAHRAAQSGVITGIDSAELLDSAVRLLLARFGPPVSVSAQVPHDAEYILAVGRTRNGIVVNFGIGGTSADDEVDVRIAPVTGDQLTELAAARVADPLVRPAMVRLATELQNFVLSEPAVRAAELNPIAVSPDGQLILLDAKVHQYLPSPAAE